VAHRAGACFVRDLGSTNGTRLNGRALRSGDEVELASGDVVLVGDVSVLFLGAVRRREQGDDCIRIDFGAAASEAQAALAECAEAITLRRGRHPR
jgi:predicted component of type VI protein secretion system